MIRPADRSMSNLANSPLGTVLFVAILSFIALELIISYFNLNFSNKNLIFLAISLLIGVVVAYISKGEAEHRERIP